MFTSPACNAYCLLRFLTRFRGWHKAARLPAVIRSRLIGSPGRRNFGWGVNALQGRLAVLRIKGMGADPTGSPGIGNPVRGGRNAVGSYARNSCSWLSRFLSPNSRLPSRSFGVKTSYSPSSAIPSGSVQIPREFLVPTLQEFGQACLPDDITGGVREIHSRGRDRIAVLHSRWRPRAAILADAETFATPAGQTVLPVRHLSISVPYEVCHRPQDAKKPVLLAPRSGALWKRLAAPLGCPKRCPGCRSVHR